MLLTSQCPHTGPQSETLQHKLTNFLTMLQSLGKHESLLHTFSNRPSSNVYAVVTAGRSFTFFLTNMLLLLNLVKIHFKPKGVGLEIK
jgi:hypothetical protein